MTDSTHLACPDSQRENAREYYGRTLQSTGDLKTGACCTSAVPAAHRKLLANIEDEVIERFYGCGSPLPEALEGCTVLDLGCGTGRDAYLAAQLVGPHGKVIGIDMTAEQLAVARRHADTHARRFGYDAPNTEFHEACIEDLASAGIADESVDVVISNCVINLSPEKHRVFSEILRVLKPGGELYFADVFVDRRLPASLAEDPVLHGECLGGAMYEEDFRRLLYRLGCPDYRIVEAREIPIDDPGIAGKTGRARFFSRTIRTFKLASVEDRCEDYGQAICYRGSIPGHPDHFVLDDHHDFETGKLYEVCGNTAAMAGETRFGAHFEVYGDRSRHYGLFDCAPAPAVTAEANGACC